MVGEFVLQHHSEQNLDFHLIDNTNSPCFLLLEAKVEEPSSEERIMVNLSGNPVFYFFIDIPAGSKISNCQ